jgi:hypothetical protein
MASTQATLQDLTFHQKETGRKRTLMAGHVVFIRGATKGLRKIAEKQQSPKLRESFSGLTCVGLFA